MSIFIDGIEMPKDGHWGTVSIPFYIHGDGSVSDSKGHVIGSAVPVPPHGKLIDANKLIERLQKQMDEASAKVKAMGEYDIGYTPDMYIVDRNRDMIAILNAQAAFIPEEGEA